MDTTIYDKFTWHLDAGIDKDKLIYYFKKLMDFLKNHQLLNKDGLEIYDLGVDSSLSINSKLLTDKGNTLFTLWFDKYLATIDFNKDIDFSFLEEKFLET